MAEQRFPEPRVGRSNRPWGTTIRRQTYAFRRTILIISHNKRLHTIAELSQSGTMLPSGSG